MPEEVYRQANANIIHRKIVSPVKNRALFSGKIKCGCCGRSMEYSAAKNLYYYCEGVKFNSGMGCFDGRLYLSELSEIVLTTVKVEAQKVLDVLRQRKQQAQGTASKSELNAELKKLSARMVLLECRGITLFEYLADGKIDKDAYLAAMAANDVEVSKVQIRVDELNGQLAAATGNRVANSATDEPVLQRVLNAETITGEVLSLIDRIIIFDDERIEIRFAFKDMNTTEV